MHAIARKGSPRFAHVIRVMLLASLTARVWTWMVPQPKANVWKTLARSLGQDHICLSSTAAGDPLSSCLVGIPFQESEYPPQLLRIKASYNRKPIPIAHFKEINHDSHLVKNPLAFWKEWVYNLPAVSQEPQELDLLGSSPAPFCIQFTFHPSESQRKLYHTIKQVHDAYWASRWCSALAHVAVTSSIKPLALPPKTFLICGDRAYAGIPSLLIGGPCTIGKLGLFTPNKTQIVNWIQKNSTKHTTIQKRGLANLHPDCDSEILHWSRAKATAVTIFLPWVAIAKNMGELSQLECWVAKQANLTSNALTDLLSEERITRQATLQNRAAIDYLLLLHQHTCEEFEGLCCFNLTSKAEDIQRSIVQIRDMVGTIKKETGGWLDNIFDKMGISSWSGSIIQTCVTIVFILFIVAIAFALIKRLLLKIISDNTSPSVNHLESGASVDIELEELESALKQLEEHRLAVQEEEETTL
ncbi:hypothetical protein HGM15179_007768 [Zosterops borbonicus]|uniref:Envelope polyprotein n=1 Tax=Zosterops borbonicus TaxID=364589 RepID=A0A8K1LMS5_9PASS|nr:hypothetical protein HGM15179_007768 [Zosterops borbonicus]